MTTEGDKLERVRGTFPDQNGAGKPSVVEALAAVMADVQSVGKTGRNTAQNYSFRGVDAVMDAVGPALRTHGVVILPSVEDVHYQVVEVGKNQTVQRECTMTVKFTCYGPQGDFIEARVSSEALDSGDKATAKAHSVAYRTFLIQALTIPTGDVDPDASSPERSKPEPKASAKKEPKKAEQKEPEPTFGERHKLLLDLPAALGLTSEQAQAIWKDVVGINVGIVDATPENLDNFEAALRGTSEAQAAAFGTEQKS